MKNEVQFKQHEEFKFVDESVKTFIKKFLVKEPTQRIKLADAVNDPIFEMDAPIVEISDKALVSAKKKMESYKKVNQFTKAVKMCMGKL